MLLENRVAVVTGAGRGIGRGHALALAAHGAQVVVNDLGGAGDGTGQSAQPAAEVVAEIEARGGIAVANLDSVATPDGANNIIQTALANFGRLDILVNNAGVLRDRMIVNMTDDEWDAVIKVNLYGAFYSCRAACRVMKTQGYGRIINTSSLSGLGSLGQTNYAAAKEGVVGFTRSLGRDMARYGVTCNAIRPRAVTRLTMTEELLEARKKAWGVERAEAWKQRAEANQPEDIAPLVVYLASEQAGNVTCCVFDVFHNFIGIYEDPPRFTKTVVKNAGRWSPEELLEVLPKTLTAEIGPPLATFDEWLMANAEGWAWSDEGLTEIQPAVALQR